MTSFFWQLQWKFLKRGTADDWDNYPPELNAKIETAYNNKKSHFAWTIGERNFYIDFTQMIQTTAGQPNSMIKVKRVKGNASAHDLKDKYNKL